MPDEDDDDQESEEEQELFENDSRSVGAGSSNVSSSRSNLLMIDGRVNNVISSVA